MSAPEWTPPSKTQLAAADEMVNVIVKALQSDRGVHAETAISCAARMAGTFLLRSFDFPVDAAAPGSAVFSDAANDRGPLLLHTLGAGLSSLGIEKPSFDGEIPDDHKPQMTIGEMQILVEPNLRAIAANHNLSLEQAAHSCALVAARLIHMCTKVLDPGVGFSLAAKGFVEGSKTMPVLLPKDASQKKGWFRWGK